MIFIDEVARLKGQTIRFVSATGDGRIIRTGTLMGLSGSGSVIVSVPGGELFVALKDIYRMGDEIPDPECEKAYRIAKYMARINNLRELVNFALEYPLTTDDEARAAYMKRACSLIGFEKKD